MVYSNVYQTIKSKPKNPIRNWKLYEEFVPLTWPVLIPTDKFNPSLNFIHDTTGKLENESLIMEVC